jgi:acetolactate synthase-1/2/3 large subunit
MSRRKRHVESTGEALLALLADRGVDYLFGNAGTDFPPIIEALSKAAGGAGGAAPTPITVPHENLAVAMAHGVYLASGRPQMVMLHVNVGTANAICGLLNAARENIPLLLAAGRTPILEDGAFGARSIFIHWGQEMFDQAGMVREVVKWDYELRRAEQIEDVVDRALSIAMTVPRGPVYLTLPREVLAEGAGEFTYHSPTLRGPATPPAPDPAGVERAGEWLAQAERPVVVSGSFGRDPGDVAVLAALAERLALPVVGYRPRYVFLPSGHPMHMGAEPGAFLKDADLIVVLDCDVPWIPKLYEVNPQARVVHVGADPLFARYPMRSFRSDLAITGEARLTLEALDRTLGKAKLKGAVARRIEARRQRLTKIRAGLDAHRQAARAAPAKGAVSTGAWVASCLNAVRKPGDVLVAETAFPVGLIDFEEPGGFIGTSPAGGLGSGLGAALGLKLGRPEARVIAVVGDGSYMFGNPTPAHFVSAAYALPTLTVILNNRMWAAVRRATLGLYPEGAAAKSNRAPLTYLEPAPEYHKIVEASGGFGEKVERAGDLPGALKRALRVVEEEGRQAVLNVLTEYSDADARRDAAK